MFFFCKVVTDRVEIYVFSYFNFFNSVSCNILVLVLCRKIVRFEFSNSVHEYST